MDIRYSVPATTYLCTDETRYYFRDASTLQNLQNPYNGVPVKAFTSINSGFVEFTVRLFMRACVISMPQVTDAERIALYNSLPSSLEWWNIQAVGVGNGMMLMGTQGAAWLDTSSEAASVLHTFILTAATTTINIEPNLYTNIVVSFMFVDAPPLDRKLLVPSYTVDYANGTVIFTRNNSDCLVIICGR